MVHLSFWHVSLSLKVFVFLGTYAEHFWFIYIFFCISGIILTNTLITLITTNWKTSKKKKEKKIGSGKILTCKLDFCLPADDGSKRVGGDALIDASVIDKMRIIDQQVPFNKAVALVRTRVYVPPIHFPPVKSDVPHHWFTR